MKGPGSARAAAAAVLAAAALTAAAGPAAGHPLAERAAVQRLEVQSVGLPFGAALRAEPELAATPRATCDADSRPETEIQGRVSAAAIAGAAKDGHWCNLTRIGRQGRSGGFKVHRYVDRAGRECAYYDTALLFPLNVLNGSGESLGVAVLDMADSANPRRTTNLLSPAMLTPHESLVLSQERGLLVAVAGNPATAPGIVDVYDIAQDCRAPVLKSSTPAGFLGHESGLSPDGKTFYSASPFSQTVVAIDISDPVIPRPLYGGNIPSHGLSVSADGTRIYVAAIGIGSTPSGLQVYDTSEIQARRPDPQVAQVGSLTWDTVSIPQNAIPVTIKGRPYVVEIDEFRSSDQARRVGAARIIDLADERRPRVVSNLRLAVHQPENRDALANDPGVLNPVQGYAGHYCEVPRRTDPGIVACSMIASGLRVFDIRDPERPREVAYHVAPPTQKLENGLDGSNFAMSAPAFAPERREVWYSDGVRGFYALRLSPEAWPTAAGAPAPPAPAAARACTSRRRVTITLPTRGRRVVSARVRIGGRPSRALRRPGRRVAVNLKGAPRGRVAVRIVARLQGGRTIRVTRRYRTCTRRTAA